MAKKALDESLDKLNDALSEIKAQMGKDTIRTFNQHIDTEIIPTDFYEFNLATNLGGLPMGKLIEIWPRVQAARPHWRGNWHPKLVEKPKRKFCFLTMKWRRQKSI